MASMFTPFRTTKTTGLGIGLALAERIVRKFGGTLRVESVEGQGTTVHLQLRSNAVAHATGHPDHRRRGDVCEEPRDVSRPHRLRGLPVWRLAEEGLEQLTAFRPAAVLLDFNLPGINGLQMLAEMRKRESRVKVIVITGQGSEQIAVDAMKAGAYDYLVKPVALGKLKIVLEKMLGQERLEEELAYYRSKVAAGSDLDSLIGESGPIQAIKDMIRRTVAADSALTDAQPAAALVTGETGTGKELVARALHVDGLRREKARLSSLTAPRFHSQSAGIGIVRL